MNSKDLYIPLALQKNTCSCYKLKICSICLKYLSNYVNYFNNSLEKYDVHVSGFKKKYNCELVSGENTNSLSVLLQEELFRR